MLTLVVGGDDQRILAFGIIPQIDVMDIVKINSQ